MSQLIGNYKLGELAVLVKGEVNGDPEFTVTAAKPFDSADFHEITLAANPKLLSSLGKTKSGAVIVPRGTIHEGKNLLAVANPKAVFARILQLFHNKPFVASGISGMAVIGEDCDISKEVSIHPFVSIGDRVAIRDHVTASSGCSIGDDCKIGKDCYLYPNVTLYPGVKLGERVIIHSGTVLGADGFGYVRDGEEQVKLPQTGGVEIGDDVEIGANSCIDRATFGFTVLERNVKIDNHVHIGHNCRIGEGTVIV
ncbi:MAG: UDP-3-O-(3-hydroxymyristoyl)glucosamine N-acyltransferase, partial [Acidobacteriota bacterium]